MHRKTGILPSQQLVLSLEILGDPLHAAGFTRYTDNGLSANRKIFLVPTSKYLPAQFP